MSKACAEGLSTLCESHVFKTTPMLLHLCDITFSIVFFDAVATRKNVKFSDRISIEKVVPENVDRKSDFFDSVRRVILPKIEKESSSTAFFDSIQETVLM